MIIVHLIIPNASGCGRRTGNIAFNVAASTTTMLLYWDLPVTLLGLISLKIASSPEKEHQMCIMASMTISQLYLGLLPDELRNWTVFLIFLVLQKIAKNCCGHLSSSSFHLEECIFLPSTETARLQSQGLGIRLSTCLLDRGWAWWSAGSLPALQF